MLHVWNCNRCQTSNHITNQNGALRLLCNEKSEEVQILDYGRMTIVVIGWFQKKSIPCNGWHEPLTPLVFGNSKMLYPPCPSNFKIVHLSSPLEFLIFFQTLAISRLTALNLHQTGNALFSLQENSAHTFQLSKQETQVSFNKYTVTFPSKGYLQV